MRKCKYRIAVEKTADNKGVNEAFSQTARSMGFSGSAFTGVFKQKFDCGLCELLTQYDFGLLECRQPDHNEETCPDIDHLRTKEG